MVDERRILDRRCCESGMYLKVFAGDQQGSSDQERRGNQLWGMHNVARTLLGLG